MNFEALTRDISPALKGIIKRLHYYKKSFLSDEDLYQEALAFLWERYAVGALYDKTRSYILQGCYFFLKNYIRKASRRMHYDAVEIADYAQKEEGDLPQTSCAYARSDTDTTMHITMRDLHDRLAAREKEVLSLSLQDMPLREIGRKLGISHVMVLKIKGRIREKYALYAQESSLKQLPK
jgi:RNA polymerase sigma factor (sigma-70 family)